MFYRHCFISAVRILIPTNYFQRKVERPHAVLHGNGRGQVAGRGGPLLFAHLQRSEPAALYFLAASCSIQLGTHLGYRMRAALLPVPATCDIMHVMYGTVDKDNRQKTVHR